VLIISQIFACESLLATYCKSWGGGILCQNSIELEQCWGYANGFIGTIHLLQKKLIWAKCSFSLEAVPLTAWVSVSQLPFTLLFNGLITVRFVHTLCRFTMQWEGVGWETGDVGFNEVLGGHWVLPEWNLEEYNEAHNKLDNIYIDLT